MKVLKCDACGEIFDVEEVDSSVLHLHRGNDYFDHMDLCPRCTKAMLYYLRTGQLRDM